MLTHKARVKPCGFRWFRFKHWLERPGAIAAWFSILRVLGTSLGVASTASMLSWRFYVLTGAASKGDFFSGRPLLGAVESSFSMLAVFAAVAAILSMARDPKSA
jgi:hypothetical protein